MRHAVHPDIFAQELLVEVATDGIVNVSLLYFGRCPRLILEDRVVVPPPLQGHVCPLCQQGVALHDFIPLRPLILLRLQRLLGLLLLFPFLLDLRQLPHQLLRIIVVVIIVVIVVLRLLFLLILAGKLLVSILRKRVLFQGRPLFLLHLSFSLVLGCPLSSFQILCHVRTRGAVFEETLARLAEFHLLEGGGISVVDFGRLRNHHVAAWIAVAGNRRIPCWAMCCRHGSKVSEPQKGLCPAVYLGAYKP
mmetsp:Transcript_52048/g.97364  ORF Transcript_52048/g.97364 Transcript_52048/m.97364 type:complete len:249 (+) Transcript_52048:156-902(+)